MNEQKIRQIVQEEIRKNTGTSRFGVHSIPYHTHNNVDSPSLASPILPYIALFDVSGNPLILPNGWKITHDGTGSYQIDHFLGSSSIYSVVVSPILSSTLPVASVTPGPNRVSVLWTDTSMGNPRVDTAFQLILMQINSKKVSLPTYTVIQ